MSIIKSIATSQLNNAEYTAFMTGFRKLITKATPEKLMIGTERLAAFDSGLQQLTDLMIKLRSSEETTQMAGSDNDRDRLLSYLKATVRYASKLPIAAQQEAGTKLWTLLKPYSNIARLPNQQETERIEGLLYDFAKPEYATHVTALGLDNVVTELSSANIRYKELSVTRTESRTAETLETGKAIRQNTDEQYASLQLLAAAASISTPSPEADEFIASLNQLIGETKSLYKLRLSQIKTEQEGEKAVTE